MYANPWFSVAILLSLVLIYYAIIRPRLQVRFVDTYKDIDNMWHRWWARIVAFRSWIATILAAVLIAAPDIIVAILPVDLSGIVGPKWAPIITALLTAFLAVNRFMATTPDSNRSE